jgi:hypothetical protein
MKDKRHVTSFLLGSNISHLGAGQVLLLHTLDDSNINCLPHVIDSKPTQGKIRRECLHHHGLDGYHLHHTSITVLQELWLLLNASSANLTTIWEVWRSSTGA